VFGEEADIPTKVDMIPFSGTKEKLKSNHSYI
jgi:hypothetical protein